MLLDFLDSGPGRIARAVAGLALILLGALAFWNRGGVILVLIGLVPLLAAVNDICFIGLLVGRPLRGDDVREQHKRTA